MIRTVWADGSGETRFRLLLSLLLPIRSLSLVLLC